MDLKLLQTRLGTNFKNLELLKQALVHRSALNESKEFAQSNERMEFLGDSVLQILTSEKLYKKFPNFAEGELTNLRSGLVRTKTLSVVAKKLNLGEFILMSRGEERGNGRSNTSLLANTMEAIIGAVFLDQGLLAAAKFLELHIFPLIDEVNSKRKTLDYKSYLQEVVQQQKRLSPEYRVLKEEGPDHDKMFFIGVYIGQNLEAQGSGKSKQEAEQEAARIALDRIK